ncbi:disease resistance protein L6-like [Rhodamnia argentea]|uniref:Disease resistance protein L6-like n=1 Tax=Rhodamnia argentea TaxID=178133 RepID=A0ABM3H6G2_9MYRT|nr:disease resistance protein L6-like [Rhodamnia argentea]
MSRRPLYEVFLSFRGPNTRKDFADILYTMLTDVGIDVFRDEEELERGKEIVPELMAAIVQSKISIPVISEDFASSKSCLRESVQMLKCVDNNQHTIIPIFYYVDPSDVRHCSSYFAKSFEEHEKSCDNDGLIDSWKSALQRIGRLKGHHIHQASEVPFGKLLKQIVRQVQQKLNKEDLVVPKEFVGVEPHVQAIMTKLNVDYRNGKAVKIGDTRSKLLLIYGITGVGKTVLAKYVYNQLYHLFDGCSFLGEIQAEIERRGILSVQNQLISDLHHGNAREYNSADKALIHIQNRFRPMKVLLLLDDVCDYTQLSALVGDLNRLGRGSRVIVTSQNPKVLEEYNDAEGFSLEPMRQDEALKLLCRHAFRKDSPPEKFKNLSTGIVAVTHGLPLALNVVGSYLLLTKSKKAWNEILTELKEALHSGVQAALLKTYINLDVNAQQIFLDIACFFIGEDKKIPSYMWDDFKRSPSNSILALRTWSLVEVGQGKKLCMHKVLKDFGRGIVKGEDPEPCNRSRLCNHEEALHVLTTETGTANVEGLRLEFGDGSEGGISFNHNQLSNLENLRFLKLDRANIQGNFGDRLSSLRWLDWEGCAKNFDDQSLILNLQNLVILDLSWSQVDRGWGGWKLLAEAKKLKVLKLTGCAQLIATPKFPLSMELERLILESCSRLVLVHLSSGNLEKLVSLNMKQCSLLHQLPDLSPMRGLEELVIDGTAIAEINFREGSMRKLKILSARDCNRLHQISSSFRYLESLKYLALDGSAIRTLHKSIRLLKRPKTLSLKNCRRLSDLPDGIGKLRSLQFLDVSDTDIKTLPKSIEHLTAMKVLRMRRTFIQKFPEAILNLEKLEEIDFSLCPSLKGEIPFNIWRLSSLAILKLSATQISSLPATISCLSRLRELHIGRCYNIRSLPNKLPFSLIIRDDN